MRCTGGPDTTIGNSMVNVFAWLYVLCTHPHEDRNWVADFKDLGFSVKLSRDVEQPSFLKGLFYPVLIGGTKTYMWGPLPSRIIKLGKSLKDPITIYHMHRGQEEMADKHYLHDQALALAHYDWVPILGNWIRAAIRLPAHASITAQPSYNYKPIATGLSVEAIPDTLQAITAHYTCDVFAIQRVAHLVEQVAPGTALVDPLWAVMAQVDYGM